MLRNDFQSGLDSLDCLLAIAGGHVDAREIGIVIAVVELEIERAFAQIDAGLVLLLNQRERKAEE